MLTIYYTTNPPESYLEKLRKSLATEEQPIATPVKTKMRLRGTERPRPRNRKVVGF
jgi:hypothetical protein